MHSRSPTMRDRTMSHAQNQEPTLAQTGRRKLTRRMLEAQAAKPAEWEAAPRGVVMGAFKRAALPLGVPPRVVDLVDYLVGCTKAADWAQGGVQWAWAKNATIGFALGLGRSQVKNLIRLALEFGLIAEREIGNGRRQGHRDARGGVVVDDVCGFDLSPLQARRAEFEGIASAEAERHKTACQFRGRITAVRNKVLSLCDLAVAENAAGEWEAVGLKARQTARRRGDCYDAVRLRPILEELEAQQAQIEEVFVTPSGVDNNSKAVETVPEGPISQPPHTPTKESRISKEITNKTGAPKRLELSQVEGDRGKTPESVLRGFIVTPDLIQKIAPNFATWTTKTCPTWAELFEASWYIQSELGISRHAYGQACATFGRIGAVTVLATISARHARNEVASPGGMLRRMVERHFEGRLRLDRTLFGLVDNAGTRLQ